MCKVGVAAVVLDTCSTHLMLLGATPFLCEQQAGEISWPRMTLLLLVSVP